jgi:hypothetical protein
MRNLPRFLIATALSTLALSTLSFTTWAADAGDPVKRSRPPYKPGREIEYARSAGSCGGPAQSAPASDDGVQPVRASRAPYKPGREVDASQDASDGANK